MKHLGAGRILLLGVLSLAGCSYEQLDFTEVKRLDERLTRQEVQTYMRIVQGLPDQKLPASMVVYLSPPDWSESRNLPVNELVADEQNMLEEHWEIASLAKSLDSNRMLQRLLRRERLTTEQFVGLVLAVGMSRSKAELRDNQDLDHLLRKGTTAVDRLKRDPRLFSSLSQEGQYYILQQASWLTRVDLVNRLKLIPSENVAVADALREELDPLLPAEFLANPLDGIADLLEEQGLPFEELASSGSDEQIGWDRAEAIIGTDTPRPASASRRAAPQSLSRAPQVDPVSTGG